MVKNKNLELDNRGAAPCKWCQKRRHITIYPRITKIDDLYYAQCPKCNDNDPYDFLAISEKKALDRWNNHNGVGTEEEW